MQIIENRALLMVTKKADQIAALIPKSKILGRDPNNPERAKILVNWDLDEVRLLRNLGIKEVPHPILGQYAWPGTDVPFEHQKVAAAFMAGHARCFNLSEAGTGKTRSVAWAADYLMSRGLVKRVLVVCPVSIMETAWRADLFRTVMHRSVDIATGSRTKRAEVIASGAEFVIINFDGVKVVAKELKAAKFDLIVVDEANSVKSVSTDRWKALNSLIDTDTRIWMMTGTPASQSPLDAYGLARIVNPAGVPHHFGGFRDKVMVKLTQYKWAPKKDALDVVYKALQPAIRFTKEECLDLPEILYTTREVPLTKQQQQYYDKLRKEMVAIAAGEEITATNAASMLTKLLQVSSGAVYTTNKEVIEFDVSNRMTELLNIIAETSKKVIVFVPFRHSMTMIAEELAKQGITSEAIHGGVNATQRGEIIKRFQTEDAPKVLLLIAQATAHGITLTRADTVVWWGPIASTELYIQGNARAHRAGQRNPVTVVHLQGSPVETRMYTMLQSKVDVHQNLVDLYKQEIA